MQPVAQRTLKTQLTGSRHQRRPETWLLSKMAEQIMDIDQIPQAQALVRIALEKQVDQRVEDHVGGRENVQSRVAKRPSRREQRRWIGAESAGPGQKPMMDIDFGAPLLMTERRNLVHPDAIVTVLVGVDLRPEPAALEQSVFDFLDPILRV